jgi:hypothetical protein
MLTITSKDHRDSLCNATTLGPFIGTVMVGEVLDQPDSTVVAFVVGFKNIPEGGVGLVTKEFIELLDKKTGPADDLLAGLVRDLARKVRSGFGEAA